MVLTEVASGVSRRRRLYKIALGPKMDNIHDITMMNSNAIETD